MAARSQKGRITYWLTNVDRELWALVKEIAAKEHRTIRAIIMLSLSEYCLRSRERGDFWHLANGGSDPKIVPPAPRGKVRKPYLGQGEIIGADGLTYEQAARLKLPL